jgi:sarcosine oxidase delta subunit
MRHPSLIGRCADCDRRDNHERSNAPAPHSRFTIHHSSSSQGPHSRGLPMRSIVLGDCDEIWRHEVACDRHEDHEETLRELRVSR